MSEKPESFSTLGLGCYALGGGYGDVSPDMARATVEAGLAAGWTFLDTAEAYLDSEVRLGEILRGRRSEVFLATKVFPCEAFSFANMRKALDNSLAKLGTDWIDLYQLHGPQDWVTSFPDAVSWAEIGDSLQRLLDSGDVRNVGVCNLPVAHLSALTSQTALFSTQNLYSILDREAAADNLHLPVEQEIIPWAAAHGVHVIAFSPLARGLLADGLDRNRVFPPDDERHFLPRFQPTVFPAWADLSNQLEAWARDHGRTLTHLAVAWTLANPHVTSTLIGAKSPEQVARVAGAETWHLSDEQLDEIADIVAQLPAEASAAQSIVWDHFPPSALAGMAERRHAFPTREAS